MTRPWSSYPIAAVAEPLQPLPDALWRLEPHPYVAAGAPYGDAGSPYRLRQGVITRLLAAQKLLQQQQPQWRLAIFDAWRPLAVQAYMIDHAIRSECVRRAVDPDLPSPQRQAIETEVQRFWAPPNPDPAAPPPHSTGAAVDLTLATQDGETLAMGSEIDAIGAVSEPDHWLAHAALLEEGRERQQALEWHQRRQLLRSVLAAQGFAQHPNEWWHFSYGDQLWAWRTGQTQALYGRWSDG